MTISSGVPVLSRVSELEHSFTQNSRSRELLIHGKSVCGSIPRTPEFGLESSYCVADFARLPFARREWKDACAALVPCSSLSSAAWLLWRRLCGLRRKQ